MSITATKDDQSTEELVEELIEITDVKPDANYGMWLRRMDDVTSGMYPNHKDIMRATSLQELQDAVRKAEHARKIYDRLVTEFLGWRKPMTSSASDASPSEHASTANCPIELMAANHD